MSSSPLRNNSIGVHEPIRYSILSSFSTNSVYWSYCSFIVYLALYQNYQVILFIFVSFQVKDKPTVEQFISMNRGINNGGDLPRTLLESLYESIRTEPFKIPQDDGNDLMHTFFNPDKEGWLWKQGGR